jgi:hypothetical protein
VNRWPVEMCRPPSAARNHRRSADEHRFRDGDRTLGPVEREKRAARREQRGQTIRQVDIGQISPEADIPCLLEREGEGRKTSASDVGEPDDRQFGDRQFGDRQFGDRRALAIERLCLGDGERPDPGPAQRRQVPTGVERGAEVAGECSDVRPRAAVHGHVQIDDG